MFKHHPQIQAALKQRNQCLSEFWFSEPSQRSCVEPLLQGLKIVMIDAEDSFTIMLAQQLMAIGLQVTVRTYHESDVFSGNWDLIVMGPGPGDPRDRGDPRIATMQAALDRLLLEQRPFLAVCLSHQILCLALGLQLERRAIPNQGTRRDINLFGVTEKVGFYNTYVAKYHPNSVQKIKHAVQFSWDKETKDIHALRGPYFASLQFHPESLLTENGIGILSSSIKEVLKL